MNVLGSGRGIEDARTRLHIIVIVLVCLATRLAAGISAADLPGVSGLRRQPRADAVDTSAAHDGIRDGRLGSGAVSVPGCRDVAGGRSARRSASWHSLLQQRQPALDDVVSAALLRQHPALLPAPCQWPLAPRGRPRSVRRTGGADQVHCASGARPRCRDVRADRATGRFAHTCASGVRRARTRRRRERPMGDTQRHRAG